MESTLEFVKSALVGYDASHDVEHAKRVYKVAMRICDREPKANRKVVSYAALLHDVDDRKYNKPDSHKTLDYLNTCSDLSTEEVDHILRVIDNCSFSSSLSGGN